MTTRAVLLVGVALIGGCSKTTAPTEQTSKKAEAVEPTASAKASAEPKALAPDYAKPPKSLGAPKIPEDNPMTAAKVELGRKLFFDKRLSVDGSRSCYSCHMNENGTGGELPMAVGAKGKKLTRHAPTLWNVAYLPALYWDGRAASLEAQATGAWKGANMGVGEENLAKKADELGALPEYKDVFLEVFPTEGATPNSVAQAIASYERTLFCGDTAYDKFAAGDESALTAEQKQGWALFSGKANCHSCHTPPFFTDAVMAAGGAYHNTGIAFKGAKPDEVDIGREAISKSKSDHASFKTPSLRNVSKSAPYFHNGAIATLEEAVRFMAGGGLKNDNLDAKLVDKKLSDGEVKALVAFLGALDCTAKLEPPKGVEVDKPGAAPAPAAASASATPSHDATKKAAPKPTK